jgi:very-short-patch-repair endonuclease
MKGGIDMLCAQLAAVASDNAQMAYDNWEDGVESPIERLLLIGMYSLVTIDDIKIYPIVNCELTSTDNINQHQATRIANYGTLHIQMQHKLLDWKADFVLSCPSISKKKAIIECDGHNFHERTKEQAARDRSRDRAAQEAGYMMLRYTGSEIYRDPLGCAKSALVAYAKFIEGDWFNMVGCENS